MRIAALVLTCLLMMAQAAFPAGGNYYHSEEHGYSITFPEGWEIKEEYGADVVGVASDGSNIGIMSMAYDNKPFDMLSDEEIEDIYRQGINGSKRKYPDIKLMKKGTSFLDGEKAVWMVTKYTEGQHKVQTLLLLAVQEETIFSLTCLASQDNFSRVEPRCWEAVESFRFDRAVSSERTVHSVEGNTYHSDEHGYSITFPEGWEIKEEYGADVVGVASDGSNIGIMSMAYDNKPFDMLSDEEIEDIYRQGINGSKRKYPDIKLMKKGTSFLDGEKAVWMVTRYTEGQHKVQTLLLLTVQDETIFSLTCLASQDNFSRVEPLCWEAVESFRFDKAVSSERTVHSAEGNTYYSKEHGYSIMFPEGWKIEKRGGNVYAVSAKGNTVSMHVDALVEEGIDFLREEGALIDTFLSVLSETNSDVKMLRKGTVDLGGEQAEFFVASYSSSNGKRFRHMSTMLLRGIQLYSVICFSPESDFRSIEPLCWKAIENFRFDRPTNSKRAERSTEERTYHSEEHGYSITFPEGWEVREEDGNLRLFSTFEDGQFMNISVLTLEDEEAGEFLMGSPETFMMSLKQRHPDISIDEKKDASLDGEAAIWLSANYTHKDAPGTVISIQAMHERTFYQVLCVTPSEHYAEARKRCSSFADSFRFDASTSAVKVVHSDKGNTYHSEEHGYSITFPDGWEVRKGEEHVEVQAMSTDMDNLNVMVIPFVNEAMEDYFRENPEAPIDMSRPSFPDLRISKKGETTLDGQEAYRFEFSFTENGRQVKMLTVQAIYHDSFYILGCGVDEDRFVQASPLCQQAFKTFKFE